VLDIGAGHGSFEYCSFAANTIGIDTEIPLDGKPSLKTRFIRCEAEALPFTSNLFDAVVGNFVFEHFSIPERVLGEIQRVLKPSGLLYVAIPNSASLEDKLFRLLGGHRYHHQRYSFYSFVRIVYQSTTLKLISFADWPAGFTWLNSEPSGNLLRRAVLRSLKSCKQLLISHSENDSGFVLLFKKESLLGYRTITDVCSNCGAGATVVVAVASKWECTQCGHSNRARKVDS
jgi:SAM-dependent methyltransferase